MHHGLVLDRLTCVDEYVERLVLDLHELGGVAGELAGLAQTAATGSPMNRTLPTASA